MWWAGHVARIGEGRGVYRVLVGKHEGKRPLGRPRHRWDDNIKIDKAVPATHTSWNQRRPWIHRSFYQMGINRPFSHYADKHPVKCAGMKILHIYFAQTARTKPIGAANDTCRGVNWLAHGSRSRSVVLVLPVMIYKGKAIPLQAWTGPEGSRRLKLPDFKTIGTWRW